MDTTNITETLPATDVLAVIIVRGLRSDAWSETVCQWEWEMYGRAAVLIGATLRNHGVTDEALKFEWSKRKVSP